MSYAHEDAPFVLDLVQRLQMRGLNVWIDQLEMLIGDSLIERVGDAILDGDFVVAIISQHSIDSPWCKKELRLAATRGVSENRVIVLPVQRGSVTMPTFLTDIFYARDEDPGLLADQIASAVSGQIERLKRGGDMPASLSDVVTTHDAILRALGIDDVEEPSKAFVAETLMSEIFDRVGERFFEQLDEAQIASFDELTEDDPDEIELLNWMQSNVPNFAALWQEEASGLMFEFKEFATREAADPEAWARRISDDARLRRERMNQWVVDEDDSAEALVAMFLRSWGIPGILDDAFIVTLGLEQLVAAARSPQWDASTWHERREHLFLSVNHHVRDRVLDILDRSQLREVLSVLSRQRDERAAMLGWLTANVERFPRIVEEALHQDVADMVLTEVEARTVEDAGAFIAKLVDQHVDWIDRSRSYGDARKRAFYAWMRRVPLEADFVKGMEGAGGSDGEAVAMLARLAIAMGVATNAEADYYVRYLLSAQVWVRIRDLLSDGEAGQFHALLLESDAGVVLSWLTGHQPQLELARVVMEETHALGRLMHGSPTRAGQ